MQLRWTSALLMIGLVLGAHSASATTIEGYASDAEFLADANFTKFFGGNVRWGNAGPSGDWEYSVVDANDIPLLPGNPNQHAWAPGPAPNDHDVTFSYDGAGFLLLDPSLPNGASTASGVSGTGINALAIRARADGGDAASLLDPITISFLSGGPDVVLSGLSGDADAEYIVVIDPRFADGFSVDAAARLQDGSGSLPQYGFKVGFIPEPGTALLVGAGLALMARRPRGAARPR